MQTKHSHIIEKELIEIILPDFGAARNWEDNYRHPFVEDVREVIDRTFSEYEKINGYLVLDKLQIDLGVLKLEDLQKVMRDRLYSELQRALNSYLTESANSIATADGQQWKNEARANEGYRLLSESRRKLESFFYFLESGRLPWWASDIKGWDLKWLQNLSESEWKRIKEFLIARNDSDAILRLITQVNDEFLAQIIKGLGGTEEIVDGWHWFSALIKAANEFIVELNKTNSGRILTPDQVELKKRLSSIQISLPSIQLNFSAIQLLRQRFWSRWILYLLEKNSMPSIHFLFGEDLNIIAYLQQLMRVKDLVREPFKSITTPSFWSDELIRYQQQVDLVIEQVVQEQSASKDKNLSEPTSLLEKDKIFHRKEKAEEPCENIFITSAGLVLLHPFLPQLFRHFGLIEEKLFIDRFAQTRAVYLLNYLATGEAETPEFNLLLPKLLCGMPWEERLEPIEPINESEKTDCEEMLVEVIRHWTALRNSSAAGLREAFLQRNGRIEIRNDGWQLIVEEKAQDVLIGRLPWGISIIKYSWMTGMLSVVWR